MEEKRRKKSGSDGRKAAETEERRQKRKKRGSDGKRRQGQGRPTAAVSHSGRDGGSGARAPGGAGPDAHAAASRAVAGGPTRLPAPGMVGRLDQIKSRVHPTNKNVSIFLERSMLKQQALKNVRSSVCLLQSFWGHSRGRRATRRGCHQAPAPPADPCRHGGSRRMATVAAQRKAAERARWGPSRRTLSPPHRSPQSIVSSITGG